MLRSSPSISKGNRSGRVWTIRTAAGGAVAAGIQVAAGAIRGGAEAIPAVEAGNPAGIPGGGGGGAGGGPAAPGEKGGRILRRTPGAPGGHPTKGAKRENLGPVL